MAALGEDRETPSCLTAYGLPDWEIASGVLKGFLEEAGNELSWDLGMVRRKYEVKGIPDRGTACADIQRQR